MPLAVAHPVDTATSGRTQHHSLLRVVLAFVLAILGTTAVSAIAAPSASAASGRLTQFDYRMLQLVNDARSDAGLPGLQAATGLTNLSLYWSGQMADGVTNNVLQHNPNAFQQTLSYGASNRTAWAENVAKWSPTSVSADSIFDAYMNSPGHRANIMGANYRYVGIASTTGSTGISYNTMTFTDRVDPGQVVQPTGNIESVAVVGGNVQVKGWAYDPNSSSTSIGLAIYVNSGSAPVPANLSRPDVNSAFSISGKHGFEASLGANPGVNSVCVWAIGVASGNNALLGCGSVNYDPPRPPDGNLEELWGAANNVHLKGWAYDPKSTAASVPIRVEIDGAPVQVTSNVARNDVNSYLSIGGNHGFDANLAAGPGNHQVCVYAVSVTGAANTTLGCRNVTVTTSPPKGQLDTVSRYGSTVRIAGWALDPNATSASIQVLVYVNGQGLALDKSNLRSDVNSYFGVTGNHGYDVTVGAPANGSVQVCAYAISGTGGGNTTLGCKNV